MFKYLIGIIRSAYHIIFYNNRTWNNIKICYWLYFTPNQILSLWLFPDSFLFFSYRWEFKCVINLFFRIFFFILWSETLRSFQKYFANRLTFLLIRVIITTSYKSFINEYFRILEFQLLMPITFRYLIDLLFLHGFFYNQFVSLYYCWVLMFFL